MSPFSRLCAACECRSPDRRSGRRRRKTWPESILSPVAALSHGTHETQGHEDTSPSPATTSRSPASSSCPTTPSTAGCPAVVVAHPGGGVKEQTAEHLRRAPGPRGLRRAGLRRRLPGRERGRAARPGGPLPARRGHQVRRGYLTTRDEIDPERIGALGICASGGYVPYAAQTDLRIKAVATVSAGTGPSVPRRYWAAPRSPATRKPCSSSPGPLRTAEARGEPPKLVSAVPDRPRTGHLAGAGDLRLLPHPARLPPPRGQPLGAAQPRPDRPVRLLRR